MRGTRQATELGEGQALQTRKNSLVQSLPVDALRSCKLDEDDETMEGRKDERMERWKQKDRKE